MTEANDRTHDITLYDEDGNPVKIVLVDGVYRLATTGIITGTVVAALFQPKVETNVAGVLLNTSTDTLLKSFTGRGKLVFIAVAGSNSNYEIAIEIDGVEEVRVTMANIGTDLGLSNATNVPIWVETANKNFRFHPNEAVGFTTSFKVSAKATTTPVPTIKSVISYAEEES